MNYCTLSIRKLKNSAQMNGAYNHNERIVMPPNADPALTKNNIDIIPCSNYYNVFKDKVKEQDISVRKNAVIGYEIIAGYTRTAEVDRELWIKQYKLFLFDTFGKENVISMDLHLDENSGPHIHAIVLPIRKVIKNGREIYKLSSQDYTGSRLQMINLQKSYGEYMKPVGLVSGMTDKRKKALYENVEDFYKDINLSENILPLPAEETAKEYYQKAVPIVKKLYISYMQRLNKEKQNDNDLINKLLREKEQAENTLKEQEVSQRAFYKLSLLYSIKDVEEFFRLLEKHPKVFNRILKLLKETDMSETKIKPETNNACETTEEALNK